MTYRWLPLAGALVAGTLIVGCGGSSKKSDASPTAGGSNTTAGKTAGAGGTAEATPSGGGGTPDPEIQAAASRFSKSTFRASYKASGPDANGISGDGSLILVKDGDKKFRFDVTTNQDGQDVSVVFIQTDATSAFCLKDAGELGPLLGIEAGKGVCFKSSQDDPSNPVGNVQDLFNDVENVNVTVLEKTSRTIAGQDGTCYRTKDNETGAVSTGCFSDSGAMLYVKTEGDSPSEIEAQSVSSDVSDADFSLPYEERELPGGLGGQ